MLTYAIFNDTGELSAVTQMKPWGKLYNETVNSRPYIQLPNGYAVLVYDGSRQIASRYTAAISRRDWHFINAG